MEQVLRFIDDQRARFVDELATWVKIPAISSDPLHHADMRKNAELPFVRTIADATGKPCLLMGFGQPDENAHAPNEWIDLENFQLGIKSAAHLYDELSRLEDKR